MRIKNGMKVRDALTGFTGTVSGIVNYITGCDQALLERRDDTGDKRISEWVDIDRLEILEAEPVTLPGAESTGFGETPTRATPPTR